MHDVNCLDVALVRRMCVLCVVSVAQPAVNFANVCIGQLKLVNNSNFLPCASAVIL